MELSFLVVVCLVIAMPTVTGVPLSCTAEYRDMKASTMCDFEDDPRATDTKVSTSKRQAILKVHNEHRSKVSPTAANMQKMVWDPEIAKIAQKFANTCPNGHDSGEQRKVPGYGIHIGQNLAWGYGNWKAAIDGWHGEVSLYRYGRDPDSYLGQGGWPKIGHYTQVVRDMASRIGCGYAKCPRGKTYVCNYAFGNAYDLGHPYKSGASCADCRSNCRNKLCDCRGKICFNGGTLDLNTCTCACKGIYAGDTCKKTNCPAKDDPACNKERPYGYPKEYCTVWTNVPEECPRMCGLCKDSGTGSGKSGGENETEKPDTGNGGGDNGGGNGGGSNEGGSNGGGGNGGGGNGGGSEVMCNPDPSHCGKAQPYGYPQSFCERYSNVPQECPAMCGLCTARTPDPTPMPACPQRDPQQCGKPQPYGFTADLCERYTNVPVECPGMCGKCREPPKERCSGSDPDHCGKAQPYGYPQSFCDRYTNVPRECPQMCGVCV